MTQNGKRAVGVDGSTHASSAVGVGQAKENNAVLYSTLLLQLYENLLKKKTILAKVYMHAWLLLYGYTTAAKVQVQLLVWSTG